MALVIDLDKLDKKVVLWQGYATFAIWVYSTVNFDILLRACIFFLPTRLDRHFRYFGFIKNLMDCFITALYRYDWVSQYIRYSFCYPVKSSRYLKNTTSRFFYFICASISPNSSISLFDNLRRYCDKVILLPVCQAVQSSIINPGESSLPRQKIDVRARVFNCIKKKVWQTAARI